MAKLTLSRPIETPQGPLDSFTIPDVATLQLFQGVKVPLVLNSRNTETGESSSSLEITLEAEMLGRFIANLLAIPPSFAARIPLDLVGEVLAGAAPLLPRELSGLVATGSAMPAS